MSTEIHKAPSSTREPLTVHDAADRISGLLNRPQATEAEPERTQAPEPPVPPPLDERALAPETPDEIDEPSEEPEVEEVQGEEEPRKEAKAEPQDGPQDDAEEIELEPSDLANLLGVDEADLEFGEDGGVAYKVKVDGEVGQATLADLRESYQLAKTHRQRLTQLSEERRAFEQEREQILTSLVNQNQQLNQTFQSLEQEFANEFQVVDWARLREEDPTEYNVKRLDFEDKRKRFQEHQAKAQTAMQELSQQTLVHTAQQQAEGRARLAEAFSAPEYANAPKWDEAETARLRDWIVEQGFSPEQLSTVSVWQPFKWARDSMLREQEQARAKETTRKIKKLPKVVKPGQPKQKGEEKRTRVTSLKARQRKSGGDLNSTADLIRGIFNS